MCRYLNGLKQDLKSNTLNIIIYDACFDVQRRTKLLLFTQSKSETVLIRLRLGKGQSKTVLLIWWHDDILRRGEHKYNIICWTTSPFVILYIPLPPPLKKKNRKLNKFMMYYIHCNIIKYIRTYYISLTAASRYYNIILSLMQYKLKFTEFYLLDTCV